MAGNQELLTDTVLEGMVAALDQFATMLEQSAVYAEKKGRESGENNNPGQELYWGGFVEGLRQAAVLAREVRPKRGIK